MAYVVFWSGASRLARHTVIHTCAQGLQRGDGGAGATHLSVRLGFELLDALPEEKEEAFLLKLDRRWVLIYTPVDWLAEGQRDRDRAAVTEPPPVHRKR
ncbi:hypothetical protein ZWY2020_045943 [Hordeum vulgare]|nr:hypothetical protein ZWY2020_045940 [Hordeum vulgare]KAI4968613.1 hypothetical protein ZWY2020_045943 [Hordeum vulgare]